ncbi:ATP-binding cassette domain-containing protein [Gilvimarinus sp. SDUM040013]|uniref:ATP-binding cassette domain-containing protein n=1 Tax=Gilvimarinus gilvus TaxID=3058038 RepID=A0ABU4RTS3_9GAMM|nr:ATP-binding cassette domain-containing protein [Gilvimarinus sp. SDUM040013]MDO3386789.1 ATP-binding cassette domain-containing protein [Gilvimarinus sp. SDUM040013]MDX6848281.1 ATP-binding cassette domain-containing protein [Gilvimarinus sp. SDUM040013]
MWALKAGKHCFHWPNGSWVGIDGPSGCGKTSLLQHLMTTRQGELTCDGHNLLQSAPPLRGIGWAAQGAMLWPNQPVERQVQAIAERHRRRAWMDLADELGVVPLLKRNTTVLSGGERQRVALLSALLSAKHILLLDEPVSALDKRAANEVLAAVKRAAQQRSLTAWLVSHQWCDMAATCDYYYGWTEQTLIDIERAQQQRVNLHPEQAAALWPVDKLDHGGQLYIAGHSIETGPLNTETQRVSIDAHDVSLAQHRPGPSSIANTLEVTVRGIRTVENNSALVTLSWGDLVLYSLITKKSASELALSVGQKVFAQFKAHAVKTPLASK